MNGTVWVRHHESYLLLNLAHEEHAAAALCPHPIALFFGVPVFTPGLKPPCTWPSLFDVHGPPPYSRPLPPPRSTSTISNYYPIWLLGPGQAALRAQHALHTACGRSVIFGVECGKFDGGSREARQEDDLPSQRGAVVLRGPGDTGTFERVVRRWVTVLSRVLICADTHLKV
jgi:hypothetical protein